MNNLLAAVIVAVFTTITTSGQSLFSRNPYDLTLSSETTLSGIDITASTTRIEEVVERLGKPGRIKTNYVRYPDSKQAVATSVTYEWQATHWRLKVTTLADSRIQQVDVWGTHADAGIGLTGQGLRLGDTIADVRRVYRLSPYFGSYPPEDYAQSGSFLARNPNLAIEFDGKGRVYHLQLTTSWGEY